MTEKFVQYGCGQGGPATWVNYDASPTLRFERIPLIGRLYTRNSQRFADTVRYGDVVAGLPEPDASADAVYCSHVLEHLALEDLRVALANTIRLLKPGGVFRLVVPDMEFEARRYLDNPDTDAVSQFMDATYLGSRRRARTLRQKLTSQLGNSSHLWMWDYKGLAQELTQAGFEDIRRASYGDATIAAFADVEDAGRWANSLGIECRKPG